jgi:hypothetical protein
MATLSNSPKALDDHAWQAWVDTGNFSGSARSRAAAAEMRDIQVLLEVAAARAHARELDQAERARPAASLLPAGVVLGTALALIAWLAPGLPL